MHPLRGIGFKLASVLVFIVMSAMIKATSAHVPGGEAVFFRSLFAIPVIMVWLAGLLLRHLWQHRPVGAPRSLAALAVALAERQAKAPRPLALIVGMLANKDAGGFFAALGRSDATVFTVPIDGAAAEPEALAAVADEITEVVAVTTVVVMAAAESSKRGIDHSFCKLFERLVRNVLVNLFYFAVLCSNKSLSSHTLKTFNYIPCILLK